VRVVHMIASFEIGGAEQVALRLATAQQRAGHEPLLVGLASGPLTEAAADAGLPSMVLHKGPRFDYLLPLRLASFLADERADVVHSHNPMALVYAASAAKLARIPAVHTKHGEARDIARRMRILNAVGRMVDAFVCVSESTKSAAEATNEAPAAKLSVILNGIDVDRYRRDPAWRAAARAAFGIDAGAFVFGTVGRLMPVKNQALLIRAAAPLLSRSCHLLLVGDGEERAALEAAAAASGAGAFVHFAGARSDVPELLAAMDAFVLSSDTEGLPLSLLEAMAAELPVLCTDVGGIAAVIAPDAGWLVPPGDEGALRQALGRLREEAAARVELARAGRARVVERYSLERMHRDYLAVYERVSS
jgi:glycosyltransferase involved in cell wall biosynthesis